MEMSLRAILGEELVALVQLKAAGRRTGKRVCALSILLVAVVASDAGETVPLFTYFTEENKSDMVCTRSRNSVCASFIQLKIHPFWF